VLKFTCDKSAQIMTVIDEFSSFWWILILLLNHTVCEITYVRRCQYNVREDFVNSSLNSYQHLYLIYSFIHFSSSLKKVDDYGPPFVSVLRCSFYIFIRLQSCPFNHIIHPCQSWPTSIFLSSNLTLYLIYTNYKRYYWNKQNGSFWNF